MKVEQQGKISTAATCVICLAITAALIAASQWKAIETNIPSFPASWTIGDHDHDDQIPQSTHDEHPSDSDSSDAPHDDHDHGDDHDHSDHDSNRESTVVLSPQAVKNLGIKYSNLIVIRRGAYTRHIAIPAKVIPKPGRSHLNVSSPMTGLVTHVHAVPGSAFQTGELLFQIRLTHEDLVNAQTEFVKTLGEIAVEELEIARLASATSSGAVAGKQLLTRQYARDKLAALAKAQRAALELHGLSREQITDIETSGELLTEIPVYAPNPDHHRVEELNSQTMVVEHQKSSPCNELPTDLNADANLNQSEFLAESPLIMQELLAHKGERIAAGDPLCILANYQKLYIEGLAFEQDIDALRIAKSNQWKATAIVSKANGEKDFITDLSISHLSHHIEPELQTLGIYVDLENQLLTDEQDSHSRYVSWKYLPGQRLELQIPVEKWEDQIVVPSRAIVQDGAETCVFTVTGNQFTRTSVHVLHRDSQNVVIEADTALPMGSRIAGKGVEQLLMELNNQSGSGTDPHAGHTH